MGWRPGTALPSLGLQGEGLLAASAPGAPTRAWYAPEPWREVPSIRLESRGDRLLLSSNGSVAEVAVDGTLDHALADVGDRLAAKPCARSPGLVLVVRVLRARHCG